MNYITEKTMKKIKYLVLISTVLIILGSCRKIVHLPAVPHIEFTNFQIFDTTDILGNKTKGGRLKFYFEDGDGDLGLNTPSGNQSDTAKNVYLTLFKKTDGNMLPATEIDPLLPSPYYRIPFMERLGQNKILKGTISVTFLYLYYSIEKNDTIRYDLYIQDRALNESNTVSTSEIAVSVNKIYTK